MRGALGSAGAALLLNACSGIGGKRAEALDPRVPALIDRAISVDMHADTVQFIIDEGADINQRLTTTQLDAPRMRDGGPENDAVICDGPVTSRS